MTHTGTLCSAPCAAIKKRKHGRAFLVRLLPQLNSCLTIAGLFTASVIAGLSSFDGTKLSTLITRKCYPSNRAYQQPPLEQPKIQVLCTSVMEVHCPNLGSLDAPSSTPECQHTYQASVVPCFNVFSLSLILFRNM